MSLFNFGEEENSFEDESFEEVACQCESCSIEHTLEIVKNFTDQILQASSVEDLQKRLYQFAELAKVQGAREYLYESMNLKYDTMIGLDIFMKNLQEKSNTSFNTYEDKDFPHWGNRL